MIFFIINNIKNELRNAAKTFRKSLKSAEKAQKDDKIFKKIIKIYHAANFPGIFLTNN